MRLNTHTGKAAEFLLKPETVCMLAALCFLSACSLFQIATKEDIDRIERKVTSAQEKLGSLTGDLTVLDKAIAALKAAPLSEDTKEKLAALQAKRKMIEAKIKDVEEALAAAQGRLDKEREKQSGGNGSPLVALIIQLGLAAGRKLLGG